MRESNRGRAGWCQKGPWRSFSQGFAHTFPQGFPQVWVAEGVFGVFSDFSEVDPRRVMEGVLEAFSLTFFEVRAEGVSEAFFEGFGEDFGDETGVVRGLAARPSRSFGEKRPGKKAMRRVKTARARPTRPSSRRRLKYWFWTISLGVVMPVKKELRERAVPAPPRPTPKRMLVGVREA